MASVTKQENLSNINQLSADLTESVTNWLAPAKCRGAQRAVI